MIAFMKVRFERDYRSKVTIWGETTKRDNKKTARWDKFSDMFPLIDSLFCMCMSVCMYEHAFLCACVCLRMCNGLV